MCKKAKAEQLRNNVRYLIKSRGETQLSLCNSSGVTRTTIYNILEGKVVNVQQSTIRKISGFFGVDYKEIEAVDIEEREQLESSVSLHGNMNPAAVPIIKEEELFLCLDKRIGALVTTCPLTYYFGMASNLICVLLKDDIDGGYEAGDMLVVKKGATRQDGEKLIYEKSTKRLFVVRDYFPDSDLTVVIGEIIEERFNAE